MADKKPGIKLSGVCGLNPFEKFGISPHLCCWIMQGEAMVVGVIGQGSSRSITAKWEAPLEQSNAGSQSAFEKVSALLQAGIQKTSISTFSTTQIWDGNTPVKFNLVLDFFAIDNAAEQVMKPIQWLEVFASPQVNGLTLGGRIPDRVTINVGRKMIFPECVIESVSTPIDKERDKDGNLIRAQVTLDIQTLTMQNRDTLAGTWL